MQQYYRRPASVCLIVDEDIIDFCVFSAAGFAEEQFGRRENEPCGNRSTPSFSDRAAQASFWPLAGHVLGWRIPTSSMRCALRKRADRQFFWMMQLPPAAFNPLHNFAAFSADAKGPTRAR